MKVAMVREWVLRPETIADERLTVPPVRVEQDGIVNVLHRPRGRAVLPPAGVACEVCNECHRIRATQDGFSSLEAKPVPKAKTKGGGAARCGTERRHLPIGTGGGGTAGTQRRIGRAMVSV